METNYQKIRTLLSNSDLSAEEQDNLLILLLGRPDEELAPLAELFTEDPSWIRKIYDNYKAKQEAFTNQDKKTWQEILKGEESMLQDILKQEITTSQT